MRSIASLSKLERLSLVQTRFNDLHTRRLKALENLAVLDLRGNMEAGDMTLGTAGSLPKLRALKHRSTIVTDDGIATGATMIAALHTVRAAGARTIIVAVPVAAPDRIDAIRPLCDRVVCLQEPEAFWAIGQFYRDFEQVADERVLELLRDYGRPETKWERAAAEPAHR